MEEADERDADDDDFLTLETTGWRGTKTERISGEEAKRRGLLQEGKPVSRAARLGSKLAKTDVPEGKDYTINGAKRAGRVSLWLILPPVGLWRSIRHGRKQHEDRLAKKIADEMRK